MTKLTRKLLLSIITVVLTVVALGTTTFAWFTLTNTSVVQPFEAEIVADSGIEVAIGDHATVAAAPLDANWVTTLTTQVIEDYLESQYNAERIIFNHVTTADGENFSTLGATSLTGTTVGYIEIPLSFRSDSATSIQWTSVAMTSPLEAWTVDVAFTDSSGTLRNPNDSIQIDASNAMRIAMISSATYGDFTVAYEKPAASNGNIVLGEQTAADFQNGGVGDDGAMNYYYAKNNMLPFGSDSVTTLATVTDINGQTVITMVDVSGSGTDYQAANFGQVMIRIWLEGWDANAYNSVLSRVISTQFVFTGV